MGMITAVFVLFYGLVIHINLGALLVILAGFTLTFALELFSAGFRAATKARQDPINWFLNLTSQLVSGLYFPPDALPWWLQPISRIHPERYILEMARLTMGGGYSVSQIWGEAPRLRCPAGGEDTHPPDQRAQPRRDIPEDGGVTATLPFFFESEENIFSGTRQRNKFKREQKSQEFRWLSSSRSSGSRACALSSRL
ncbi:hypothetical protein J2747_000627 [Thermococcus stetteri]|nr:hypothetical protein [Thermococcus stetteri]